LKVQQFVEWLNGLAPFESAEGFDNVGFLMGDPAAEVHSVLIGMDITDAMAEEAIRLGLTAPRCIIVSNKSDLPVSHPIPYLSLPDHVSFVETSALTGEGMDRLELAIENLFPAGEDFSSGELLTNARQAEAASRASAALERAANALTAGFTPDAVLTDVEEALAALGELTGRTVREDIVTRIFERFCVGK